MKLIAHRCNTIAQLQLTPIEYGLEVDIRSFGNRLIMHHDPFIDGEEFRLWLECYRHGTIILNVKEEGLELRILEVLAERGIEDFFFLDQSFPLIIRMAKVGERRCAVRVSEFEHVETALSLAGMIDWVWVDCFSQFSLSANDAKRLRNAGFKLCVVSPELQGRVAESEIFSLRILLGQREIIPDAVCTKFPKQWSV